VFWGEKKPWVERGGSLRKYPVLKNELILCPDHWGVRLAPNFVNHLLMLFYYGVHKKSHISRHLLSWPPLGIWTMKVPRTPYNCHTFALPLCRSIQQTAPHPPNCRGLSAKSAIHRSVTHSQGVCRHTVQAGQGGGWGQQAAQAIQAQQLRGSGQKGGWYLYLYFSYLTKVGNRCSEQEASKKKLLTYYVQVRILGLRPKMTPPPNPPSSPPRLIKRVSICSESKQLSANTVLLPIKLMPEEL